MTLDPTFWHERWQGGVTPWHESSPNKQLVAHFHRLKVSAAAQVLVPLCGKSKDMQWLQANGCRVLGVELSEIAAQAFFEDSQIEYTRREQGAFTVFEGSTATVLCGDVFALRREHLSQVTAVYDRAALIALDAPDRQRYALSLPALLPAAAAQLVVTLHYDAQRMDGPPFSVSPDEIKALYGERYQMTAMEAVDVLEDEPRFRARGLSWLTEQAFLLQPNPGQYPNSKRRKS